MKYSITLTLLFSLFCIGCDTLNTKESDVKKTEKKTTQKSDSDNSKRQVAKKSRVAVKTGSLESGSSGTVTTKTVSQSFSSADAVNSLFEVIADSTAFGSTLVICCLDETPSSQQFVKSATDQLQNSFAANADGEKLLFAVAGYGDDFHLLTDEPVSEPDDLKAAFARLGQGKSETENGLSAVTQAYEKFREFKTDKRYQVMVVVVTDETPSDREKLDEAVLMLSADEAPVYVIGNPAPFGRQTVGQMNSSAGMMNYGPETIALERIDSDYWMDYGGMEALDSGFGPWAWERLCRKTQGRFLAVRPSAGGYSGAYGRGWPASSRQFDPGIMARYAPDYGSEKEYLASLETNSAKMALHNASKLSRTKFSMVRGAEIMTGDEAAMARNLNRIQQPIAAGLLPVQNLYEALKTGEADRDKLDSPRWKASFDLAMGRATANFVRLDGANSMMAKAKSGMKFEDSSNNKWSLEPSDEINTGGAHTRLAETATKYLQGIVDDYPDTPWAYIAEQELKSPMGWKWVEGK